MDWIGWLSESEARVGEFRWDSAEAREQQEATTNRRRNERTAPPNHIYLNKPYAIPITIPIPIPREEDSRMLMITIMKIKKRLV